MNNENGVYGRLKNYANRLENRLEQYREERKSLRKRAISLGQGLLPSYERDRFLILDRTISQYEGFIRDLYNLIQS